MIRLAFLALLLAAGPLALRQQQSAFRVTADVVPIYVTVRGSDGRLVPDLEQDDFTVLDDGQHRPVVVFSNRPVDVTMLALWEASSAMGWSTARSRAVGHALIDALWARDRARVGSFNGFEFAVSPLLTGDKSILRRVVDEELWPAAPGAALWAAIDAALRVLRNDTADRRVLLIFTSGKSAWGPGPTTAVETMHRTDIMVYAMGSARSGLTDAVRQLAVESGGGFAELGETANLGEEFRIVLEELHHQYLLGIDARVDGKKHQLAVHTHLPGASARSRSAYVSFPR